MRTLKELQKIRDFMSEEEKVDFLDISYLLEGNFDIDDMEEDETYSRELIDFVFEFEKAVYSNDERKLQEIEKNYKMLLKKIGLEEEKEDVSEFIPENLKTLKEINPELAENLMKGFWNKKIYKNVVYVDNKKIILTDEEKKLLDTLSKGK